MTGGAVVELGCDALFQLDIFMMYLYLCCITFIDANICISLFIFLVLRYVVTAVVFMRFMFCLYKCDFDGVCFDVCNVFITVKCSFVYFVLDVVCFVREWSMCVRCILLSDLHVSENSIVSPKIRFVIK